MRIGMVAVTGVISLWVVEMIVNIVAKRDGTGLVNTTATTSLFYQAYVLLGLNSTTASGVFTILGIFVGIAVLAQIIDLNM